MRCLPSVDEYLQEPTEAFFVDREFCAFHTGTLFGIVAWGRPALSGALRLVHARTPELTDPGPHHVIIDYRQIGRAHV